MAFREPILPPQFHWEEEEDRETIPSESREKIVQKREKARGRVKDDSLYEAVTRTVPLARTYVSEQTGESREVIFEPSFIAAGAEHLVFDFENPKHQGVVYKVNFRDSIPAIGAVLRGQGKAAEGELKKEVKKRDARLKQLREYFDRDAVPPYRMMVREVPISPEVVQKLSPEYRNIRGGLPETVPAVVTVQKKIEQDPDRTIGLRGYYAEHTLTHLKNPEAYEKQFDAAHEFLTDPDADSSSGVTTSQAQALAVTMFPDLIHVHAQCQRDPVFKEALSGAVRHMVRYTTETGTALDFAGRDNLLFEQVEDNWKLRILDPFVSSDDTIENPQQRGTQETHMQTLARFATETANRGSGVDEYARKMIIAMNALNAVRTINALAVLAGVPDRVKVPEIASVPPREWREMYSHILRPRPSTKPPESDYEDYL